MLININMLLLLVKEKLWLCANSPLALFLVSLRERMWQERREPISLRERTWQERREPTGVRKSPHTFMPTPCAGLSERGVSEHPPSCCLWLVPHPGHSMSMNPLLMQGRNGRL